MFGRRLAGTATALILVAAALAGCSAPKSDAAPSAGTAKVDGKGKTLTFLTALNAIYPQQQQSWFAQLKTDFQTKTGATLNVETYTTAQDEQTKLQTAVVAQQGPDVFDVGTTFTPTAYATGSFREMSASDWTAIGGKDRLTPAAFGISGPSTSKQIGIPYTSIPYVLAYNTKLLSAAGISKPATTWDGWVTQAKKLTGNGVYGIATDYKDSRDPWKFIWALSQQMGNPLVDGSKLKLDDPTTRKAYAAYFGLLTQDKVVDPESVGWTSPQALAAFASGKAAFLPMTTSAAIATLDNSAVKDDYRFTLMPSIPPGSQSLPHGGKPAVSIVSGENLLIAKYSRNPELALALVNVLTSESEQTAIHKYSGSLPVNVAAASAIEKGDPKLQAVIDSGKASLPTPFNGGWSQVQLALQGVVTQAIPNLSSGSISDAQIKQLLTTAQQSAQSAVAQSK